MISQNTTGRSRPGLLFIGNFLDMRIGTRAISEDLALRLAESGWPVLVTSRKTGRVARLIDMLWTVWSRRKDFQVAMIDVYSGPAFRFAEAVSLVLGWLRKPVVLILHGGNLPNFAASQPGRVRRVLNRAALVITPSNYLLQKMQRYCRRLQLIPNPIAVRAYPMRNPEQARPELVWLRAFHRTYNPTLAISVVRELQKDFPDIHLTMAGPDKNDGTLQDVQEAIEKNGVRGAVTIAGPVAKSEVPRILSTADVFLNTTNVDNTPVSVLEAMACGLCVISTNVGGIPYLVRDGVDALLVEPNNVAQMAEAVRRALRDPDLARSLSANARRSVESFDWPQVLSQWEQLLQTVA